MADYHFYPSLLDAFERYRQAEGFRKTKAFKDLMDALNRVPFDSEAKDKGTAFNAIVDALNRHEAGECTVDLSRPDGVISATVEPTGISPRRVFYFNRGLCEQAAGYFEGSRCQVFVSAMLSTSHGDVLLYGYADEVIGNRVFDIKTTKTYYPDKYIHGWQRHVYPYCLVEMGERVDSFEYTAFELVGGTPRQPVIRGIMHSEWYSYNHEDSTKKLTDHVEDLIRFIKENKEYITNQKLFGKQ